ncbi:integrator complex subunit 11 [Dendrobium catenatum]|uniref:Integrator complex subunit 11 n=1 Tax=Dendrobium catenatum TaxID=906689 RepID=A0A2I0WS22_9ASPA|nr:integrator complex subunit 11 [Dendrobium catenatum]
MPMIDSLTNQQMECQLLLDADHLNPNLCTKLNSINNKLAHYNSTWSSWTTQRAKVNWLVHGEEDLKFFYSRIHRRKAGNNSAIVGALLGSPKEQDSKILDIIQHFMTLLNQPNPVTIDISQFPKGSYIPNHLADCLIKPITFEEVKATVFSGHSNSTPGLDRFNIDFYKTCWHVIGKKVFKAVQSFFSKNYLPKGAKATTLVLIPKTAHANNIGDFRPIALCNVFYKIIAKILADRMKMIMPDITHKSQVDFISKRLSTDNPLLASKIMNICFKSNSRNYFCAKFDIKKAFDTVSRDFLLVRMIQKGFPSVFINWIKACIYNVNLLKCFS